MIDSSRRAAQIQHHLEVMEHRRSGTGDSDCYLILTTPAQHAVRRLLSGATNRVVQFAFMAEGYYLDLPDTTVTMDEARTIAARPGYDFALNNENKRLGERQFDPLQKHFTYLQHAGAATDVAYLFFDLWQTPIDAPIRVTSASFEGPARWEDAVLLT